MQQHAAGHQRQTAETGDDERHRGGPAGSGTFGVEANQQERGDRSQLPEREQPHEAVGEDQSKHRAHKEQQDRHEAAAVRVAF